MLRTLVAAGRDGRGRRADGACSASPARRSPTSTRCSPSSASAAPPRRRPGRRDVPDAAAGDPGSGRRVPREPGHRSRPGATGASSPARWPAGSPGSNGLAVEDIAGTGPRRADRARRRATRRRPQRRASRARAAPRRPQPRPSSSRPATGTTSRTPGCVGRSPPGSPRASREAPHFYVRGTARVDALLALRARDQRRRRARSRSTTWSSRPRPPRTTRRAGDERDLDAGRGPRASTPSTSRSRSPPTAAWSPRWSAASTAARP